MKKKIVKYLIYGLIIFSSILVVTGAVDGFVKEVKAQNSPETSANLPDSSSIAVNDTVSADTLVVADTLANAGNSGSKYQILLDSLNGSASSKISFSNIMRGILGIIIILFIAWLFSVNRKAIKWKYVLSALLLQIVIALCIIYVPFFAAIFTFIGKIFVQITASAEDGTIFLFGNLVNFKGIGYMFAFKILPTIIFFSTISSILFYWGVIQIIVKGLGWLFSRQMGLSGVESLSLAANIFMGQTEAPLIVKAYLPKVSDSEMFMVMVGGMATMAGGVLSAYIAMLGGGDHATTVFFARHLLAASVMAAPAAVVVGRIVVPQTDDYVHDVIIEKVDKTNTNILDVIANGAIEGTKLAVNVAAMLFVFVALISLCNFILFKIGAWTSFNGFIASHTNYNGLSLQCILGYALSPIMWLIGVPTSDIFYLGQLLGEKTIINEFVGYASLTDMIQKGLLQPKSIIMGVYLMCGFANFSSIGIQIGGIGSLAPNKRHVLSKFGMRALVVAAATALLSSVIMGSILG